jgi:hypothetical protein
MRRWPGSVWSGPLRQKIPSQDSYLLDPPSFRMWPEMVGTRCEAILKNGKRCKREGQLTRTEDGRLTLFCLVHRRLIRESRTASESGIGTINDSIGPSFRN